MPHELRVPDVRVERKLAELGRLMRRRRLMLGVSQDWLARAAGLDQSTVSRLENGRAPSLRLERYARILSVLDDGAPLQPWRPDQSDDAWLRRQHRRGPSRGGDTARPGPRPTNT